MRHPKHSEVLQKIFLTVGLPGGDAGAFAIPGLEEHNGPIIVGVS